MLFLIMAVAAFSGPQASSLPTLSPGTDLYPAPAFAAKESGTSTLTFDIMPNGSASNCTVTQSSGFVDLDRESCLLATSRQQFAPHQGPDPVPIREAVRWTPTVAAESAWNGAIPISPESWVTAADYPSSALQARHQGTVQVQFDVTEGGATQNCEVIASSGDADLDAATCRAIMDRADLLPAVDADGRPRTTEARFRIKWQIPQPAGGTHQVIFDAQSAGSVCYIRDDGTSRLLTPAFCEEIANSVSEAGGAVDGIIDTQLPDPIPYASAN